MGNPIIALQRRGEDEGIGGGSVRARPTGECPALVPQVIAVWRKKSDEGISLITFGGFSVLQAIGILHGVYQRDASLILGMAASLLSCGSVTLLTLLYRTKRRHSAGHSVADAR